MKKIIIAMSVMALAFTACQKQSLQPAAGTNSNNLPSDVTHYYHGQIVTTEDQIPGYTTANVYALLTDQLNNKAECYYFDSESEELQFAAKQNSLKPIYDKLLQAKDMREYAISSGALEHFNQTGELREDYLQYIQKYRTRAFYTLCTLLNGAGGTFFVPGPVALLPAAMDNNAESYKGNFNTGIIWRDANFMGPNFAFFGPAMPFINLPVVWRNVATSAN